LGLVFSTLTILPVDIFLVSTTVDQQTGIKKEWATPEVIETMTLTLRIVYFGKKKKRKEKRGSFFW
jgi:LMBR1 domain-containing protein 1